MTLFLLISLVNGGKSGDPVSTDLTIAMEIGDRWIVFNLVRGKHLN
jgi:hypothetical protein